MTIKCPCCDHDHCTTLRANRHPSGVIMRSRLCAYCKQRFSTYQRPGETHQTVGYMPEEYRMPRQYSPLTFELAEQIRERVGNGENQRTLAVELGIHRSTVGKIVRNILWAEDKAKQRQETRIYKVSRCYSAGCVHWERKCTMGFTELDGRDCACYAKEGQYSEVS